MDDTNYLVFLLNNRLNENYSIRELKNEIKERLKEIGVMNEYEDIDEEKLSSKNTEENQNEN